MLSPNGKSENRPQRRVRLELEELETRALLSVSGVTPEPTPAVSPAPGEVKPLVSMPQQTSGTLRGYTPTQIQQAYGASSLIKGGTNGAGETIAIVDAGYDPSIVTDVNTFDSTKQINLPPLNLSVVGVQVGTGGKPVTVTPNAANLGTDPNWAIETALDVEWAHAMAPGANIVLVETPVDNFSNAQQLTDLLAGVQYASGVANVVSMSWGVAEFGGESGLDQLNFGNQSVTYVAASGDNSAYFGPIWPATSPYVLAVGGTSLSASGGTYRGESGWFGSGGGYAGAEGEPSFQSVVGNTGARMTPDVAFDANPSTGVAVLSGNHWYQVGGTSLGSPSWAGIVALADQAHGSSLGTYQVESTLYNTLSNPSTYKSVFHDITRGGNGYGAGTGYDLVTGLGSPIVNKLVPLLASTSVAAGLPGVTGKGTLSYSSSSSGFRTLASVAPGVGLYSDSSSVSIGVTATEGTGAAAGAAKASVSVSMPSVAPLAIPAAVVPTTTTGSPVSTSTPVSFNFASAVPLAAPTGNGAASGDLSGGSAAPATNVFGASGWNGASGSMRLSSFGLHGPLVDRVTGELAGESDEDSSEPAPSDDASAFSGGEDAAPDVAAPEVVEGAAGEGDE